MTIVANFVHNTSLAVLAIISAKSFDNIIHAAEEGSNSMPHLMLSLSRLSVVMSQFSAMAMATAVITVVRIACVLGNCCCNSTDVLQTPLLCAISLT